MIPSRTPLLCAASCLAMLAAAPAHAQDAPAVGQAETDPEPATYSDDEIVVIADRIRGAVDADQPPIVELEEADIQAYGASSIAELLAALAPQTGSGRGRGGGMPVILVNGMRVSSFRELRSYPPEAINKVEILPEEVAQRYGFSADQRVINFILKDGFTSREIEVEYGQPDRGGMSTKQAEATYLRIDGPSRLNINLEWNDASLLTEAERGIIQSRVSDLATDPDPGDYRSLVSDSASLEATANWSTKLGDAGSSLSLNGTYERNDSRSLSGLNTVTLIDPSDNGMLRVFGEDDPLERRTRSETYSFGSTLNAPLGDWQLTGTLDAAHGKSRSEIDRYADTSELVAAAAAGTLAIDGELPSFADNGFDVSKSDTDTIDSQVTFIGSPFYLPAGDVSLTFDGGYKWNRIQSQDTRNPGLETDLSRSRFSAGVNLGVPIASRRDDAWAWLGDFSLNFTAGIDDLSDFGTLTDWSAGLVWGLTEKLNLQASYIASDRAPSLTELGANQVETLNVPVYDFTRGETVQVTTLSGGNPDLAKEQQRDIKIGAFWDLPFLERSSFSIEYFRNHSTDVSASFPLLTPAIEAAFPDRVTRDGSGQLVAIDQRPVTFAEQNSSRLRFGINLSGPFGKAIENSGGPSIFGMVRNAGGSPRTTPPAGAGPGSPPTGQSPQGGPSSGAPQGASQGGPQGGFDPARFAEMRQRLCGAEGEAVPELSTFPEQMRDTMRGEDGKTDPARYNQMRERVCSTDGAAPGGAGGFDPERFAAMRKALCEGDGEPDLSALPEPLLARLRGPDGEIDPEKLAQFKERACSAQGGGFGGPPQGGGFAGGPGGSGPPAVAPGAGGGGRGPGGFGGGPPGGDGRGRWFLNLNYSLELENEVLIAEGLPVLDLLGGDALSGGGVTRHSAQLVGGLFYNGFGMRLSGNYSGSSRIDGTGLPGSQDLEFGSLATLDVRLFADLGRRESLVEKVPFLSGTRIALSVDNVFDSYRTVTDANGEVPLSYQRGFLDPQGRKFEIEFRKMF